MPSCPGSFSFLPSACLSGLRPACSRAVIALLVGLLLMLGACGPVPQPYRSQPQDRANDPLIAIPDGRGITVAPVEGAMPALSGPLTEALVLELQGVGIPASSGAALTNSLLMEGNASWRDGAAVIEWRLSDTSGGQAAAVHTEVPADRDAFRTGDDALVSALAQRTAILVATALRPDAVLNAVADADRTVAVVGVDGAPGDGNRALSRAMEAVLADAGVTMADDAADASLLLAGAVGIELLDDGMERVSIRWWLMASDGTVLGSLEQSNIVPQGSLSERWGGAAYDAALANVDAVREILARIDEIRELQRQASELRN